MGHGWERILLSDNIDGEAFMPHMSRFQCVGVGFQLDFVCVCVCVQNSDLCEILLILELPECNYCVSWGGGECLQLISLKLVYCTHTHTHTYIPHI